MTSRVSTIDLLLVERKMMIEDLAEQAGLEVGRTEAIAVGRWTPSPAERVKVAGALGVSVEAISWGHTMDPRNIRYHQYGMQEDF